MLRLLILTPQLPYPPQQGTSLRNYYIIRGLSERHQITLLSFHADSATSDAVSSSHLLEYCATVETVPQPRRTSFARFLQIAVGRRPDMALRLSSPEFVRVLSRLLERGRYHLVQVEGLELAFTIPTIRAASPDSRVVYDSHNAETELQRRALHTDLRNPRRWHAAVYSWLQVKRLRPYELWACRNADWVTAVSEPDRRRLRSLATGSPFPVTVIPNCIDVRDYLTDEFDNAISVSELDSRSRSTHRWDLVFIGKMDYRPNVDAVLWFADEIWPLVRAKRPATTWAIVGQRPHARLSRLKTSPGVTFTGFVESVIPYLANAAVCIMPFRMGSGTRLKLIEAMAAGRAIVSTSVGAEGFPVEDGRELLLADSPEDMAEAILRLLDQPEQRKRIGRIARQFASKYDWRTVTPAFDAVYRRVL